MPETHQARFSTVVAKAGKPAVHLTWLPVEKDPMLKAALASNRVMTVHQVMRGGRKDYATVGFIKAPQTQLLIFPKSLKKFSGQRIVAIDYELLADPPRTTVEKMPVAMSKPGRVSRAVPFPSTPVSGKIPKPAQPPAGPVKPPPEAPTPLSWSEAMAILTRIKRDLKGRLPAIGAEIETLRSRMQERLKPH